MTRDELIALAKEAGIVTAHNTEQAYNRIVEALAQIETSQ